MRPSRGHKYVNFSTGGTNIAHPSKENHLVHIYLKFPFIFNCLQHLSAYVCQHLALSLWCATMCTRPLSSCFFNSTWWWCSLMWVTVHLTHSARWDQVEYADLLTNICLRYSKNTPERKKDSQFSTNRPRQENKTRSWKKGSELRWAQNCQWPAFQNQPVPDTTAWNNSVANPVQHIGTVAMVLRRSASISDPEDKLL